MWPRILFAVCLLSLLLSGAKAWEHCYVDPDEDVTQSTAIVLDTFHRLIETSNGAPGIELWLKTKLNRRLVSGHYQVELWHEESGARVNYKGPYDLCCGFRLGSTCADGIVIKSPEDEELPNSDCPLEGELVGKVAKPLNMNEGKYEATLKLFARTEDTNSSEEVVCVVIPFEVERSASQAAAAQQQQQPQANEEAMDGEAKQVLLLA